MSAPPDTPPLPLSASGWLVHPLARGRDLDDPRTTLERREILAGKPFLRQLYREWYRALAAALPHGQGRVLELGSGAGFLGEVVPGVVRSEVFVLPGLDAVLDGQELPFALASLRGILMTNVLHHIPEPMRFLRNAARVVRPGGVVAMVEPWVTGWSRLVYRHLHYEPFEPAASWTLPSGGPLSSANDALPWILFARDREMVLKEASGWCLRSVRPMMPLAYLLSGGLTKRSLAPGMLYGPVRLIERALGEVGALFALIVLERE